MQTTTATRQGYRRAAMVIASLDRRAADAILERFPPAAASAIRQELISLADLDQAEQDSAIRDFLEPLENSLADLPDFAPLRTSSPFNGDSPAVTTVSAGSPIAELQNLSDQVVATSIYHERIATIAALISVLPGTQGVRILRLLGPEKRSQVVNALGRGICPNPLVVDAVARNILEQNAQATARQPALRLHHHDALGAILDEMDEGEQAHMLEDLALKNPLLARRLGWRPPTCPDRAAASTTTSALGTRG